MTTYLKKLLGEAGAGLDRSHGGDSLYTLLSAMIDADADVITKLNAFMAAQAAETGKLATAVDSLITQFNSFRASIAAERTAIATAVDSLITQFNQLRTDYNAETDADHDDTTATAVTTVSHTTPTAVDVTVVSHTTVTATTAATTVAKE